MTVSPAPAHAADTGLGGTVTAAATGEPLRAVRVEVLRITDPGDEGPLVATATTDRHGGYRLPDLAPGEYVIGFSREGFVTEYSGRENDPWEGREIGVPGRFDGQLTRAARLRGTLADRAGQPVPAAEVTATPAFHDSLAAIVSGVVTDGRYTLDGILPGPYAVTFHVGGHPPQYVPEQLIESRAAHVPLRAGVNTVDEELLPAPTGFVRGRIVDRTTGRPVAGACLDLTAQVPPAGGVTSQCVGADGAYAIAGLATQPVSLFVYDPGSRFAEQRTPEFTVRDAATVTRNVALAPRDAGGRSAT